jgi:stearoyl-CoA desaturase (Delta-9 desaturase)
MTTTSSTPAALLSREHAVVVAVTDPTFTTDPLDPEHQHAEEEDIPTPLWRRLATMIVVIAPPIGLAAAIVLLWGVALSWVHLVLLLVGYLITGFGITIGYHRLFTHKSFDAHPALKVFLGIAGSMAAEGPILEWVAKHRLHHQHSDKPMDPHSPHVRSDYAGGEVVRTGVWGKIRGAFHSHMGWLFRADAPSSVLNKYIPDLLADKLTVKISNLFMVWLALSLIVPGLIAWAVTGSWIGGLLGVLWGGVVRIFMVHHITWSVNSVCHIWGSRPFNSHDHSRNNPIVGVLALGEGWHNAHHAFPASARHGLRWWEFDSSYVIIKVLAAVGLVTNIRVPSPERIEAKKRKAA